jgi:hypothetical protein
MKKDILLNDVQINFTQELIWVMVEAGNEASVECSVKDKDTIYESILCKVQYMQLY